MLHTIKIIASAMATILALIAYLPYLIDMLKGKSQPHLYTWISIFLVTSIVGYIQLVGGAGIGAIPTILGAAVDFVILCYCFKFGTKDIVLLDRICLAVSILGVISYLILNNRPIVALVIVTIAEVTSFIPTFRKTRNSPYSESLPSYYLLMLKLGLILVALKKYNLLTASYSILWIFIFVGFLSATYSWRSKLPKHKRPSHLNQDAPLV